MERPDALARGLWGVLASPFDDGGGAVDEPSLRALVHDQLSAGAVGLVVLGVFGEGARLTRDERHQVLGVVRDAAPGTPLVVGISELDTQAASDVAGDLLTVFTGEGTARAVSFMIQVPTEDACALVSHLEAVHETTGVGVVVQDYPVASGVRIGATALLEAVSRCPFVVAVKSEAPPTSVAISELVAGTTVPVFGGLGGLGLLDELMAGAAGAMTGFSHPQVLGAVLRAWEAGGYDAARAVYLPWLPLVNFEAQVTVGLAIRKAALRERGIITDDVVRPPGMAMPQALRPLLDRHLQASREQGRP